MFDSKPLIAKIVRLQQEKDVKVSELARVLGATPSRFSAWRKGKGQCDPKLSQLTVAANILGVNLLELLTPDTVEKKDAPAEAEKPVKVKTEKAKKPTAKAEAPAAETPKETATPVKAKPAKKAAAAKAEKTTAKTAKAPKTEKKDSAKAAAPKKTAKAVSEEKPAKTTKRSAKK